GCGFRAYCNEPPIAVGYGVQVLSRSQHRPLRRVGGSVNRAIRQDGEETSVAVSDGKWNRATRKQCTRWSFTSQARPRPVNTVGGVVQIVLRAGDELAVAERKRA